MFQPRPIRVVPTTAVNSKAESCYIDEAGSGALTIMSARVLKIGFRGTQIGTSGARHHRLHKSTGDTLGRVKTLQRREMGRVQ